MSQILYALVVLQGTALSFSPGYTSASECLQQYKGPNVACFAYDAGPRQLVGVLQISRRRVQDGQQDCPKRPNVSGTSAR